MKKSSSQPRKVKKHTPRKVKKHTPFPRAEVPNPWPQTGASL